MILFLLALIIGSGVLIGFVVSLGCYCLVQPRRVLDIHTLGTMVMAASVYLIPWQLLITKKIYDPEIRTVFVLGAIAASMTAVWMVKRMIKHMKNLGYRSGRS